MQLERLYLDTCIFIAYYKEDDQYHKSVKSILRKLSKEFEFVTSDFTFTELVSVLIGKGMSDSRVYNLVQKILRTKKIGNYSLNIVDIKGKERNYEFSDFFVQLQEIILNSRPGIGDAIHIACIKNNGIKNILTTNKKDFEGEDEINIIEVGG